MHKLFYRFNPHLCCLIRSGNPTFPQTGHSCSGVGGCRSHSSNAALRCCWTASDSARFNACTRCIRSCSRLVVECWSLIMNSGGRNRLPSSPSGGRKTSPDADSPQINRRCGPRVRRNLTRWTSYERRTSGCSGEICSHRA